VSRPVELVLGTYTERLPHVAGTADGILGLAIGADGSVGPARTLARLANPSWVAAGRGGRLVVAGSEVGDFGGEPTGAVASYARDPETGELTPLGAQPSGGASPAFVVLDPSERFAIVANYRGGSVAVLPIDADGRLGAPVSIVQHTGSGPNRDRQTAPHAHHVLVDPHTGELLVCDLGADRVVRYTLDDGRLTPVGAIDAPAGSGPRHAAVTDEGDLLVVGELDGTLQRHRRTRDGFELAGVLEVGAHPAALRLHPGGLAAVSVRSSSEFVLVRIGRDGPIEAGRFPAGGRTPRDLLFVDDRLLVAHQDSGTLAVFDVDPEAADVRLLDVGAVPTPVSLVAVG